MAAIVSIAALLAAFYGCSGVGTPPQTAARAVRSVKATVEVRLPPVRKRGRHRPKYISPSTTSVTFALTAVNGSATIPVGFTSSINVALAYQGSSAHCTYSAGTSSYTCTETWVVPAASDTFAVTAYDGTSKVLSENVLTKTVSSGSSTIAVTLWGVPASVSLTTSDAAVAGSQAAGFSLPVVPTSYPFTALAYDADGNAIVGPGAPTLSVSFSPATSYTATTPGPSGSFLISPQTGASYGKAGVTVVAAFPTGGPTPFPTSCPSAACSGSTTLTAGQMLFVGTQGDKLEVFSVAALASALAGSTSVAATNTLSVGFPPYAVAFDPSGHLFVNSSGGVVDVFSTTAVASFASGGSPAVTGTLKTGGDSAAVDTSGDLFASYGSTIEAYSPTAIASALAGSTNVTASGTLTTSGGSDNLIFDSSGDMFVTNTSSADVTVYSTAALASALAGGTAVAATGTLATGADPDDLGFDASGNLFVCSMTAGAVDVFSAAKVASALAGSTGVAMSGSLTAASPAGIAFDNFGNLVVPDANTSETVSVFSKSAAESAVTGSTAVAASGTLSNTGHPSEVYFDGSSNLIVGELSGTVVDAFSSAAVTSAAGGATAVAPTGTLSVGSIAWKMTFGP